MKKKDRRGKDLIYNLNSKRTEKELDWKSKTKINEGILKIINFTNKNIFEIKKLNMEYNRK